MRFLIILFLSVAAVSAASVPYETARPAIAKGPIDELVFARLKQLDIEPAHDCSDTTFVRRVYLDVIGTLPTLAETTAFLDSKAPDKRRALIDELLTRDEFAEYWAMKWSDLLRVKAEYPINLWPNAAQAYHRWIVESIHANKPFDLFARELLVSNGSNFRVGPVNFYRALQSREPRAIARAVALTFMGARAEKWPAAQLDGLAAFFTKIGYKATGEWKEEIVFFDPAKSPVVGLPAPVFPDGTVATIAADRDPREVFADWLVTADNPWFSRAIANRVWFWLIGRGIVNEPDDLRPDNPAANPELLDFLAKELTTAKFHLKEIFRLILNSQCYQLSCVPRSTKPEAAVQFAFYPLRRLEAEVLIDAINQVTGATEKYSSAIPEPYTYVPEEVRSISLPDGSITSSFLEMFGRPPRDTGQELERNNRVSATQRLYLLNSSVIRKKLEQGPKLQALFREKQKKPSALIETLYLTVLSRRPTAEERQAIQDYARDAKLPSPQVGLDLAWALVNSAEFLHRH
ncbi:MAG: DUF1553 domain-containing protein [Nibricoccus sp.]